MFLKSGEAGDGLPAHAEDRNTVGERLLGFRDDLKEGAAQC